MTEPSPPRGTQTTILWFAEIDGKLMTGGFFTKRAAIDDVVGDYHKRSWSALRRTGYTVSKYEVRKL